MLFRLLQTKFETLRGRLMSDKEGKLRAPMFLGLSVLFWAMLFRGSLWIVSQAIEIEPVGELLVQKLLANTFLVFLALLVFSNIVTVFTTFYLADDLQFLMSKPIPSDSLYMSRFAESLAQSSWILIIFGLPILIASGIGVGAPPSYYVMLVVVLVPFVALPTALATLLALVVTNLLEADRMRDVTLFFGLVVFTVLFVAIRAMRPERLLNPESFESIGEMLRLLSAPTSAYLPSDWCLNALVPVLFDSGAIDWWSIGMLYSTPLALFFVSAWAHRPLYKRGYSKAQEGRHGRSILTVVRDWLLDRTRKLRGGLDDGLAKLRETGDETIGALRQLIRKDQLVFVRDASQWSQLLVVVAIMIIYLVNYKYFEIAADEKLFGEVGLFYFNLAACGFVVVALAGRFLFPSVSLEGRNFWIILQGPFTLETYLTGKWLGAMAPVVIIGQGLIWLSNLLVAQNWFFLIAASAITLVVSVGIAGLAVGTGAIYGHLVGGDPSTYPLSLGSYLLAGVGLVFPIAVAAGAIRLGANALRGRK
ncbi:MAG: hypothetical protein ABEN55_18910 [Bradymonadaceae bacterium]